MSDQHAHPAAHQTDLDQAKQQVNTVDAVMVASRAIDPLHMGSGIRFGRTDFENHQLNDMIDMVESAKPEHLETAGKALWDARDAINDAADELGGHIGRIDWEGESATAFRDWATDLVTNAYTLGLYAENVGTQITAAGTGLASVRKSMPPRDTRLAPKSVHDFATVEQVDSNKDYQAARKVEGHRQEAVNQMNRLASFYAVSEETIRGQEEPTFGKMPGMGVPKAEPDTGFRHDEGAGRAVPPPTAEVGRDAGMQRHLSATAPATADAEEVLAPSRHPHDVITKPQRHLDADPHQTRHVGTDIDSAQTLPPDIVKPTPDHALPVPAAPGGGGIPVPPLPTGPLPPGVGTPAARVGAGGTRGPFVTEPRLTPPPGGPSRVGNGTARGLPGPVGRPAGPGQAGARGAVPPVGRQAGGQAPVGRSVVGGVPRTGGAQAGRAGGAGPNVPRPTGVIGGRPSTPTAPGGNRSTVPRGTVIGGQPASRAPGSAERPGRRGVVSAPEQANRVGQVSRTSATDGVAGTLNGRTSAAAAKPIKGKRRSAEERDRKAPRRRQAPETE